MHESYALELIKNGKRLDGRKFEEFRSIEIKENIIQKAEGSAEVRFGDTRVIAGVKLELSKPFSDTPEEGMLKVSAEFVPSAAPEFEPGPPSEDAIELARIVDRGIRESKCIELEKLCIEPKEKVWGIFIDIHIINHQGNLLDCSALASLVALLNTKIPKLEDDVIIRGKFVEALPIVFKPINVSVCKAAERFLVDPSFEEENIMDSRLSVCVREDEKICSIQKQGRKELSLDDIEKMVDIALEKSKEIRKLIK